MWCMAKRRRLTNPRRRRQFPNLAAYFMVTGDSQLDVAEAVGATQPQISRIVRGLSIPRHSLARRLADYCRIPIESFMREYTGR
jgi:transcriptional regulator with XRE-family HTH domain